MTVSFAIQAHPDRAGMAADLAAAIGGHVDVVYDPDPDGEIRSPWRTFQHVLRTAPPEATHRFQVQDDARVCRNLRAAVELAAAARPDRLLVFFVGGSPHMHAHRVLEACRRDEPWAELGVAEWCPAVATCWPAWMAAELLEFVDSQQWSPKFVSDDERVGHFVRAFGHRPLASVPSLVEHPDLVPSLIGRRHRGGADPGRVAACWIGDCDGCDDPALIDWTRGPGA